MVKFTPFLFDNFIEDDHVHILDLSINHSAETAQTEDKDVSTPEILNKIRSQLMGLIDDE